MTGKWIGFNYGLKVQTETKLKSSGKLNFVLGQPPWHVATFHLKQINFLGQMFKIPIA